MKRRSATTPGSLHEVLASLPTCDRSELLARWQDLHAVTPPSGMSTPLLLRAVAYKLQERAHGGLKPAVRRFLEKAVSSAVCGKAVTGISIAKPGTRLVREWRGVTYEVIIIPDGVLLNGKRLGSLSEAAHAITGAKWSGPRFFGLVKGGRHGRSKAA